MLFISIVDYLLIWLASIEFALFVPIVYTFVEFFLQSLNNRPLVPPRPETTQLLTQQQEQDLEQMKMFVQLRQDLERVSKPLLCCYIKSHKWNRQIIDSNFNGWMNLGLLSIIVVTIINVLWIGSQFVLHGQQKGETLKNIFSPPGTDFSKTGY